MAASSDDSEDDNFVVLGTAVPELAEGEPKKKPTTLQDLTARDKQGRRRFHGAFTGGFSAGYFNTVGTKEGFTPSTFLSSRSQKNETSGSRPEDFMDEEDFDEHGIAPRKFATVASYTSEERKRKLNEDSKQLTAHGHVDLLPALTDLVIPEQLPIGIKLLRKMGWREGQGLGPRLKKKKKKRKSTIKPDSASKVYGCAPPPSDQDDSDSGSFVPENLSDITFAPKDVCPISLEAKDNVHGLGYRGLDPTLALPSSHINLFDTAPLRPRKGGKGIKGQAFGVGAFEDEDEDIYAMDNMSNYDITMKPEDDDEADSKFGWTAPRKHGKQVVPVSYVGKLLEGFTLSSQQLAAKKKFPPPVLPPRFKPQHWFRKRREVSHMPASLTTDDQGAGQRNMTAVDRGLMLGETPIVGSVFDLIPKEEKARIEATKEAIAITQQMATKAGMGLTSRFQPAETSQAETNTVPSSDSSPGLSDSAGITNTFLAKFKPAGVTHVEPGEGVGEKSKVVSATAPLFQGSLSFQPFRKDAAKQARYDTYLAALKQGVGDPYTTIGSSHLTEWEKARERDEFSKASKIYRPMSALMSSRFVRGAMIDEDRTEVPLDTENEKSDRVKAAEMKMFGKLTREEFEWHPDKLLCRRFNVPNPYPGSDLVGLPTVKRDKYSVFNFLSFGDYQSGEFQEPSSAKQEQEPESRERTLKSVQSRKATMTSIFKVLDDPDFHQPAVKATGGSKEKVLDNEDSIEKDKSKEDDQTETSPDKDLFRAIFKNSDSESSSDESMEEQEEQAPKEEEGNPGAKGDNPSIGQVSRLARNIPLPPGVASALPAHTDPEALSRRLMSQHGDSSVFSVLDDLKHEPNYEYQHKTDDHIQTETASSRLLPPADEDDSGGEYGPSLPPASGSGMDLVLSKHISEIQKVDTTENPKDKRHRHKKEKKKKSKHKKEKKHKKHKSRKSKKSRQEESCSGSEADTEDSDVSDSELMRRLKEVSGSSKKLQLWKQI